MAHSIPFGARSTADEVLAGVDLSRKRFLVTECDTGIGFETMNALAANGAHVIGLARTLSLAQAACAAAGTACIPIACDSMNLESVAAAAGSIRRLPGQLDAVIANAADASVPTLQICRGIERRLLVDYLANFVLVNQVIASVRGATGRIVIVSGDASVKQAPAEGIMFDNLDGRRFYDPMIFRGQAKLAAALYAKELSRRLASRGIAVNSLHPGANKAGGPSTRLDSLPLFPPISRLFMKSSAQAAATHVLLAASPRVEGITGEYWSDCKIARGNPRLTDTGLAKRLWAASEQMTLSIAVERHVLHEAA
jgi:WW domain-containing oxidoreductase